MNGGMNLALKSRPVAFEAVWGWLALATKFCACRVSVRVLWIPSP